MFPIKMIYQPSDKDKATIVDVYSFNHTHDSEGNIINTFVTGWVQTNKNWLTAPVWCFQPYDIKILKEGD